MHIHNYMQIQPAGSVSDVYGRRADHSASHSQSSSPLGGADSLSWQPSVAFVSGGTSRKISPFPVTLSVKSPRYQLLQFSHAYFLQVPSAVGAGAVMQMYLLGSFDLALYRAVFWDGLC